MKRIMNRTFFSILFGLILTSCIQTLKKDPPVMDPPEILKSLLSLLEYKRDHLRLSEDFIALDTAFQRIGKERFLEFLSSGEYLPLRLSTDSPTYRLHKLDPEGARDIRTTLGALGKSYYRNYKMEGLEMPDFNFTDLQGRNYNKENTKGKILVFNFWFINCQACKEEMPALNKLVKAYENRQDILFISLALNPKEDLKAFLSKTSFNYIVVPDQKTYLEEDFKVTSYPTQVVVNKQGLIVKVADDYTEMIPALYQEQIK